MRNGPWTRKLLTSLQKTSAMPYVLIICVYLFFLCLKPLPFACMFPHQRNLEHRCVVFRSSTCLTQYLSNVLTALLQIWHKNWLNSGSVKEQGHCDLTNTVLAHEHTISLMFQNNVFESGKSILVNNLLWFLLYFVYFSPNILTLLFSSTPC